MSLSDPYDVRVFTEEPVVAPRSTFLELRIGPHRYQVYFDASGEIYHINKLTRRRSGRLGWRWVWPTGKKRETATSSLVRDELLRLRGRKLGQ